MILFAIKSRRTYSTITQPSFKIFWNFKIYMILCFNIYLFYLRHFLLSTILTSQNRTQKIPKNNDCQLISIEFSFRSHFLFILLNYNMLKISLGKIFLLFYKFVFSRGGGQTMSFLTIQFSQFFLNKVAIYLDLLISLYQ